MFSGGFNLEPIIAFIPPVRPVLRGHPFKVLQGPCQRLRRKSSLSIGVVKYWNGLPTSYVTAPQLNLAREEFFARVLWFPVPLSSPQLSHHIPQHFPHRTCQPTSLPPRPDFMSSISINTCRGKCYYALQCWNDASSLSQHPQSPDMINPAYITDQTITTPCIGMPIGIPWWVFHEGLMDPLLRPNIPPLF